MVINLSTSSSSDDEAENHQPKQASVSRRQRRTKKVTYVELSDDPLDNEDADDPDASLSARSSSDEDSSYSAAEDSKSAPPAAKRRKLSASAKGSLKNSAKASSSKKLQGKGSSRSKPKAASLGLTSGKSSLRKKSGKGEGKKDAKVNLKRRKLKIDEEADKMQAEALKKVIERGLLESDPLDLGAEHGKLLPDVLLRCNMSQITVKKASRKRERKYMFVFPGQLAVLDHGVSGHIQGLSTNKPTLTLDLGGGGSVVFYGSVVHPKNDYVVLECKQNGKQVNCHDGMSTLVIFHSYKVLGKLTAAETEGPDLEGMEWENPPTFEKEEKTSKSVDDDEDDDVQDTDEELPNDSKNGASKGGDEGSKARTVSRTSRKKNSVSYVESGSDDDGNETPESEGGYD